MARRSIWVAAALAVLTVSGAASAEDDWGNPPDESRDAGSSGQAERWEVPGVVVIDGRDDLSDADVKSLLADVEAAFPDATFQASDLEGETRIEVARVSPAETSALVSRFGTDARVESAEPLSWIHASFVPNDPLYEKQWNMKRVGAESAWDYGTGRGVTVAVVDTGIACEDYEGFTKGTDLVGTRCVPGWNFIWDNDHANDDQGHGSHVAGTIAQTTDNGVGVAGLAFGVSLMPVKVLDKRGWGTTLDVANGIRWAGENGAQVVNLSLGGPQNSKVLQDAVDDTLARGVIIVAAAGNSGGAVGYPGGSAGVIGVSASDPNDKLAAFSSRGKEVDIAAPGVGVIQQTICEGGKNKCEIFPGWQGTSMASPHVAAAAALLVAQGVTDPVAVEKTLESTARDVDSSPSGRLKFGAGILDAGAAVKKVTFSHGLVRLALVGVLSALAFAWARRSKSAAGAKVKGGIGYWIAALAAGPGLLFFAPLFLSRVHLGVDVLARPIADLDFYVGASLHRLLPLANAVVAFALMILTWHSKTLRKVAAGFSVGTAAYLVSLLALGETFPVFGTVALFAWCGLNAAACLFVARTSLAETK
ncbi:MAG TPA: S8 family peptidase [Polyangiaceae bacterium]|nr:S8 family peptidase [Polyangiaceae bacterium]